MKNNLNNDVSPNTSINLPNTIREPTVLGLRASTQSRRIMTVKQKAKLITHRIHDSVIYNIYMIIIVLLCVILLFWSYLGKNLQTNKFFIFCQFIVVICIIVEFVFFCIANDFHFCSLLFIFDILVTFAAILAIILLSSQAVKYSQPIYYVIPLLYIIRYASPCARFSSVFRNIQRHYHPVTEEDDIIIDDRESA